MQHDNENLSDLYNSISYEGIFHDIKTPLSLMYASLQEIEQSAYLHASMKRSVNDIKKNWFRIMKMITDSCDLQKISTGRMLPAFKNCDIVTLVRNTTESTRLLTARKNITVHFNTSIKEKIIAMDKDILDRILLNILSNSIKFTGIDGIINLSLEEEDDCIIINIRDNGKGIRKEDALKVQEKYFKDMSPYNKNGSGLGLYIVKGLVALLGGDLTINYREIGAEVIVAIPYFVLTENVDNTKYFDDFHSDNLVQIELSDEY